LSGRYADKRVAYQGLATLSLATLILYRSCPRGLMWFDSGELALASATWGLAHPPGQPLYTALGGVAFQLGGLFGLNLLSALSLVALLATLRGISSLSRGPLSAQSELLGLLWVCLYPVWDQGARVELYATASALGFASIYCGLLSQPQAQMGAPRGRRALWLSGLSLGACGATNAIFAVGFGLSLLWVGRPHTLARLLKLSVGVTLGFTLPHLYLLWAVRGSDGFVWGDFSSQSGLWAYLSGADYRGTGHSAWASVPEHLIEWFAWSAEVGAGLWCLTALVVTVVWRAELKGWGVPLIALCGLFPLSYERYWPEVPDFTGYLLPIMGLSLLVMWRLMSRLSQGTRAERGLSWALLVALLASQLSASPEYQARRDTHHLPLTLSAQWLTSLPEGSALLVRSDHWVFPLMYLQEVTGVRRDILVLNVGFSRSSWYWRWLRRRHPSLPKVERVGAGRLRALVERWPGPVYAEELALAVQVTPRSRTLEGPERLRFTRPPCPAGWGVSVGCERPIKDLDPDALRALAQAQGGLSPISARVLARHSVNLSLAYWSAGDAQRAISLGYAALGEPAPLGLTALQWWPAPPQLWAQGGALLLGEPALARAVLDLLAKTPQTAPSPPP